MIREAIRFSNLNIRFPQTDTTLPAFLGQYTFKAAYTEPIPANNLVICFNGVTLYTENINALAVFYFQRNFIAFSYIFAINIKLILVRLRQLVLLQKLLNLFNKAELCIIKGYRSHHRQIFSDFFDFQKFTAVIIDIDQGNFEEVFSLITRFVRSSCDVLDELSGCHMLVFICQNGVHGVSIPLQSSLNSFTLKRSFKTHCLAVAKPTKTTDAAKTFIGFAIFLRIANIGKHFCYFCKLNASSVILKANKAFFRINSYNDFTSTFF